MTAALRVEGPLVGVEDSGVIVDSAAQATRKREAIRPRDTIKRIEAPPR
jgi:hypothetical protein